MEELPENNEAGDVNVMEELTENNEEEEDDEDGQDGGALAELAKEIHLLFMSITERSAVLRQSYSTLTNLDTTIYWQRAESQAFSGRQGLAQAYVISGPH